MILTYHGGACIRASAGDTTLVFGPISKQSKHFKPTNFGADVAFISVNHPDMNGKEEAARADKIPFVIRGPGEYEIKDITAAEAQKLSVKLEAKIVIPILFNDKTLKQFLKEAGTEAKPIEKLTLKPRDVVGKENEVVVLSA